MGFGWLVSSRHNLLWPARWSHAWTHIGQAWIIVLHSFPIWPAGFIIVQFSYGFITRFRLHTDIEFQPGAVVGAPKNLEKVAFPLDVR